MRKEKEKVPRLETPFILNSIVCVCVSFCLCMSNAKVLVVMLQ